MVDVPQTEEGWYMLHDFRQIDWDGWRNAPQQKRERAARAGREYLAAHESAADSPDGEGTSAVFSIIGHKADLMIVHLRPTLDLLSQAERQFERTALAEFTTQPTSYVSVTEVSGYVSDDYFKGDEINEGLRQYIEGKLKPEIPDGEYACFYPMSKRRGEEHNWYTLPFEERAEMMSGHGATGKQYAGDIDQIIASSIGFDDHEWGVTLFAEDPVKIKDIVYEMRFDEATSKYGEFPGFYIGRRFPPADLLAYLSGEAVPTAEHDDHTDHHHGDSGHSHGDGDNHDGHGDSDGGHHGGDGSHHDAGDEASDDEEIRGQLADMDLYAGQPHGEDVYATVLYSEADTDELFEEVDGLRGNFDHYGTHVKTAVYEAADRDRSAVVSIWDTASAADTAAGFLSELPDVVERADEESGFGTMGMFYTVKPDSREDFVDKFDTVGGVLAEMDGHLETDLMINEENENDMFIASQWESQEDAMGFFRSDDFQDTVEWGRDVLADRPRHVFLA